MKNFNLLKIALLALLLLCFFGASKAEAAVTINKPTNYLGMVGYWTFDGKDTPWTSSTAATTADVSGNGNTGTLTNMNQTTSPTAGKRGQALQFDGVDDQVTIANTSGLHPTLPVTISAWVNATNLTNSLPIFKNDRTLNKYYGAWLIVDTSGAVNINYGDGNNPGTAARRTKVGTSALSTGVWYHVVGVIRGATDMDIYINGVNDGGNYSGTAGSMAYTSSGGSIGMHDGSASNPETYGNGKIDDVRFYNRALSATEVASLYGSGSVKSTAPNNRGLVNYWSFNEGTGTIATDFSGNGNTGTLVSGPTWVSGKHGNALNFNGTNQYVQKLSNLGITGYPFTLSAWIKTSSSTANGGVASFNDTSSSAIYKYIGIRNGKATLAYSNAAFNDGNTTISDNAWHHIVGVFTSDTSKDLYVDGKKDRTTVGNNASWNATINTFCSGAACRSGISQYFPGSIDEVRVYNRALSATDIVSLFKSGYATINASQNNRITNGLVGLWSFDGKDLSTTTAFDRSGQGNDGTLTNGPTRTIGKIGQALSFSGASQYVNLSNNSGSLNLPDVLTISAWIKYSVAATKPIISRGGSIGNTQQWQLRLTSSGKIQFIHGDNSAFIASSNGSTVSNTWNHVVAVRTGSSGNWTISFYINGVFDSTVTTSIDPSTTNLVTPRIGSNIAGDGSYFTGLIDDVRVYNRALSASEIKQLYLIGS